jgi:REP-associated tyrosine transposase
MLVSVPPKLAISVVIGKLKGKSSYFIRQEFWNELKRKFWGNHLGNPNCYVTCGGALSKLLSLISNISAGPSSEKGIAQSLRERKVKVSDAKN